MFSPWAFPLCFWTRPFLWKSRILLFNQKTAVLVPSDSWAGTNHTVLPGGTDVQAVSRLPAGGKTASLRQALWQDNWGTLNICLATELWAVRNGRATETASACNPPFHRSEVTGWRNRLPEHCQGAGWQGPSDGALVLFLWYFCLSKGYEYLFSHWKLHNKAAIVNRQLCLPQLCCHGARRSSSPAFTVGTSAAVKQNDLTL